MMVPLRVLVEHEAHAALDETAGDKAGHAVVACHFVIEAIHFVCKGRFVRNVDQTRGRSLHPEREFVRLHARSDFRVPGSLELLPVEFPDHLEIVPLHRRSYSVGTRQAQDRVSTATQKHTLVIRRQEAIGPVADTALCRAARLEDDESRQIARLSAEP